MKVSKEFKLEVKNSLHKSSFEPFYKIIYESYNYDELIYIKQFVPAGFDKFVNKKQISDVMFFKLKFLEVEANKVEVSIEGHKFAYELLFRDIQLCKMNLKPSKKLKNILLEGSKLSRETLFIYDVQFTNEEIDKYNIVEHQLNILRTAYFKCINENSIVQQVKDLMKLEQL